jgi:SlyX protein
VPESVGRDLDSSREDERVNRLEERLAWLQRHVTEQDRAMLDLTELVEKLRHEVLRLRDRSLDGSGGGGAGADAERPPHY